MSSYVQKALELKELVDVGLLTEDGWKEAMAASVGSAVAYPSESQWTAMQQRAKDAATAVAPPPGSAAGQHRSVDEDASRKARKVMLNAGLLQIPWAKAAKGEEYLSSSLNQPITLLEGDFETAAENS